MPYLFEDDVAAALAKDKNNKAYQYLEKDCQDVTRALMKRKEDYPEYGEDPEARKLAIAVGQKTGSASRYVKTWAQIDTDTIRRRVVGELDNAYGLKLDIRREGVVGAIYELAVKVLSTLGAFSGPSDDQV